MEDTRRVTKRSTTFPPFFKHLYRKLLKDKDPCKLCCSLDGDYLKKTSFHSGDRRPKTFEELTNSADAGCFGCSILRQCIISYMGKSDSGLSEKDVSTRDVTTSLSRSPLSDLASWPSITLVSLKVNDFSIFEDGITAINNTLEVYRSPGKAS